MAKWLRLSRSTVIRASVLFAFWLLLTDSVRPWMLRHVYRLPILLVADSLRVTVALVRRLVLRRPLTGRIRATRYGATGDDAEDVARRVLTEWAGSLAPNRYVIGIDPDDGLLLVHELVETTGTLDPLQLG